MWLNTVKIHSSCIKMNASNKGENKTPRLFSPSESTNSSKRSVLRKKLQAEKLALELKIAEETFANEIEFLRAEQQQRAKLLELQKKAEESRLEYEFEDAIAQEEVCQIKAILMKS